MTIAWVALLLAASSLAAGQTWGGCTKDGLFPDPSDCTLFHNCAGGQDVVQKCPTGLVFNPLGYCDYPSNVACASSTTTCTPNCGGKQCGSNGCGGTCGTCASGKTCNATGQCVTTTTTTTCVPSCSGKVCGSNGCGGSCGTCVSGSTCSASGQCVTSCVPSCSGKTCGSDGCGSSCGSCTTGLVCGSTGQCAAPTAFPFKSNCPAWAKFGPAPPTTCSLPSDPQNRPPSPVEQWLTEAVFNDLFPKANIGWGPHPCLPYSYQAFRIAARYFPTFASGASAGSADPSGKPFPVVYTKDQAAKRELAAFLAHAIQETGENDAHLYSILPVTDADACFYRGGMFNWLEGGPVSSFVPSPSGFQDGALCTAPGRYCDSSSTFMYPCSTAMNGSWYKGCYFGRGTIQLSYNFNYGLFSRWLNQNGITHNGGPVDLLKEPNLLLTKTDPPLALLASIWFFMTPQPPKPAMSDIINGNWISSATNQQNGFYGPIFGPTSLIINNECNGEDAGPVGGAGESRRIKAFRWFCNYFGVSTGDKLSCKGMADLTIAGKMQTWDVDWATSWQPGPCKCALTSASGIISGFDPTVFPQYTTLNPAQQAWCEAALNGGWQNSVSGCAGRKPGACVATSAVVDEAWCAARGCPSSYCACVGGSCGGCVPSCSGKACGSDGCGGSCGTCASGKTCNATGQCVTTTCVPNCSGKVCGSNGCGGSCGTCVSGSTCEPSGQCVASCVPSCSGKTCGSDGCGGSCGTCSSGMTCTSTGVCNTTTTTTTTFSCKGKLDGFYPDPVSCTKYHVCSGGLDSLLSCPSGLYWNQALKACDWPANVACTTPSPSAGAAATTPRPYRPQAAAPRTTFPQRH